MHKQCKTMQGKLKGTRHWLPRPGCKSGRGKRNKTRNAKKPFQSLGLLRKCLKNGVPELWPGQNMETGIMVRLVEELGSLKKKIELGGKLLMPERMCRLCQTPKKTKNKEILQPLWKSVRRCLKKLKINLPYERTGRCSANTTDSRVSVYVK